MTTLWWFIAMGAAGWTGGVLGYRRGVAIGERNECRRFLQMAREEGQKRDE
jgi:hypothetical protein